MNLTLNDLDADVARRLSENPRFARLHTAGEGAHTGAEAAAPKRGANKIMCAIKSVGLMLLVQLVALCVLGWLDPAGKNVNLGFVCGMLTFFGAPLGAIWWYQKSVAAAAPVAAPVQTPTIRPDAPLALADMRDASRFLFGLPQTKQGYMEAVIALWEAAENQTLSETEARDLLRQMNDLLASDHDLESQETRLARLGGDTQTARLVAERDALAVRAAQVADPDARQSLQQSLALCDERLKQAREVAPLRERVCAQREMLAQTLAALHQAVLRLGVVPSAANLNLADEIQAARDTASRIAGQSRAVEAAVQEVMAIGAG